MSESEYGDRRNRVDEWAYCATKRIGVVAAAVVCAAFCAAALAIAAAVVWSVWGWLL